MGLTPGKSHEYEENVRVVPRGVYEILRTGKSPIEGLDVVVSEMDCGKGHIITYVKRK